MLGLDAVVLLLVFAVLLEKEGDSYATPAANMDV